MKAGATIGRRAAFVLAALLGPCVMSATAAPTRIDARVLGTFSMRAQVTAAVNVRGEHAGQVLRRRWLITPRDCQGSVCRDLELRRQRSDHRYSRMTLHRIGVGRYRGTGAFYAGLSCKGKVYARGSRARYTIVLRVTAAIDVGGVTFARQITATYDNRRRSDTTPCPLGPSYDAARYSGRAISPMPVAPVASFSAIVNPNVRLGLFTDTSSPASSHSQLIRRVWNFDDPGSGAADTSARADALHFFAVPGRYEVTLTDSYADGLSATAARVITIPAR